MNEQYLELQSIAHDMFESLPLLNSREASQPSKLQDQACCYIKKILSIFEKYQANVKRTESLAKFCGIP